MRQFGRWWVAGLVTMLTFTVCAWICGALILPTVINDPNVRWGLAGGLGVAVAALAALWGHSFATAQSEAPTSLKSAVNRPQSEAIAVGGENTGIISTGGNAVNVLQVNPLTPSRPAEAMSAARSDTPPTGLTSPENVAATPVNPQMTADGSVAGPAFAGDDDNGRLP
jgi:hypothetical protein